MDKKPTVRIFCQSSEDYSLSIRHGKVVLALSNPVDPFQHWIKEERCDGFTLFNKGTAQAIKRSSDVSSINKNIIELLLISMPFGSHSDPHAVWIGCNEEEDDFVTVSGGDRKMFTLQPHSTLTYDGNTVLLYNEDTGPFQKWKFVPYYEDNIVCPKTFKIYSKYMPEYNLTIRHDTVVYARCDRADQYQHWRKETRYCNHLKDKQGFPAFAIVNVATGKAIQHRELETGYPVSLLPFTPTDLDESVLWTESEDLGSGYKNIKVRRKIELALDVLYHTGWYEVGIQDGMRLGLWTHNPDNTTNQFKMEKFF